MAFGQLDLVDLVAHFFFFQSIIISKVSNRQKMPEKIHKVQQVDDTCLLWSELNEWEEDESMPI